MSDGIASSLNGLNGAQDRLQRAAKNIADAGKPNNKTDLANEIVQSKISEIEFSANAKVLKAQLDTQKKLLDILA